MVGKGCLLLQRTDGWVLATTESPGVRQPLMNDSGLAPDALAQHVAEFVTQHELSDDRILLAPASFSVLAARFEASAADQRNRRTLAYRLESSLPLAAEEFVADFFCRGERVLGVALPIDDWLPIVQELDARGLHVQSICPAAMLALQAIQKTHQIDGYDVVVWQDESAAELARFEDRQLGQWHHVPADSRHVARLLAVEMLKRNEPARVALVNASPETRTACRQLEQARIELTEVDAPDLPESAVTAAAAALGGAATPWFDLRRGDLSTGDPHRSIRGPLRLCLVAALLLMITLSGAFLTRSWQNRQQVREFQSQQAKLFHQAFPTTPVPAAILSRLRSEKTKLAGARGDTQNVRLPTPAMSVLFELLAALPERERFRLRELRIENGQLDLDVEVAEHAGVTVIVQALEDRGFEVSAPSTVRQSDDMVSSRIFATYTRAPQDKEPS